MNWTWKILTALAVIAVVAVLLLASGLMSRRTPEPEPMSLPSAKARPGATHSSRFFSKHSTAKNATTVNPTAGVSDLTTNSIADWEDQIAGILNDETEVEAKAKKVLELFPRFPEAGQIEAAQHISNLLADEDYQKFGNYLTNATTPESVQDIILADVLNRPNAIKLPLLLDTARTADNAKAGDARELLGLYLEEDYGADWDKWRGKMEQWLKEHPD